MSFNRMAGVIVGVVGIIAMLCGIFTNDASMQIIGHIWCVGSIILNTRNY